MTTKERLLQELESAPEALLEATLQFVLTHKTLQAEATSGSATPTKQPESTYKPIWEVAQKITSDMTPAEIAQLPKDGAEQHDHYIYGTPKHPV